MKKKLPLFLISLILINCGVNKNVSIFYEDKFNETEKNTKYEKWYYENTPEEYYKKDDEILIFFSGQAFKGSRLIINKKDTLKFKEQSEPLECLGYKMYIVKKNSNFLNLISDKKKEKLKLKIDYRYNYVTIGSSIDNLWGVTYYPFFPNISCR